MGFLRGFAGFWYDFIIGDDWKIAVAVVLVLLVGIVAVIAGASAASWLPPLLGALFAGGFAVTMAIDVRKK